MQARARAHDLTTRMATSERAISSEALEALRAALRTHPCHADHPATGVILQRAMRSLCRAAIERDYTAERLLVEFKEVVRTLPEARQLMAGSEREEFLSRLVTVLIRAYYATPAETDSPDVAASAPVVSDRSAPLPARESNTL